MTHIPRSTSPLVTVFSNPSRKRRLRLSAAGLLAFAFAANSTHAANATWGGSASGNWSSGANWSPTTAPGTAGTGGTDASTAFFGGTTAAAITLDTSYNLKNFTFQGTSAAYTIGATGGSIFTLSSTGAITVNNGVTAAQTISAPLVIGTAGGSSYTFLNSATNTAAALNITGPITSAGTSGTTTLTLNGTTNGSLVFLESISGNISDSGTGTITALTKTGAISALVSGVNTYSGTTTLSAGGFRASDGVGLPTTSALLFNGSGALVSSANFTRSLGSGAGQVSGSGEIGFEGIGGGSIVVAIGGTASPTALTVGAPNFTIGGGTLFLNGTGTASLSGGANLDFRNPVNANGQALNLRTVSQAGAIPTISGVISGTGAVSDGGSGNGFMIFSGANTFDAPVTLSNGILLVKSINSVSGGTASSNLGAPTTAANGTINLSGNSSNILLYNGTGETTDRIINLVSGGGTIAQEGPLYYNQTNGFSLNIGKPGLLASAYYGPSGGLLKITGNVTATSGANTLTLSGGVNNGTPLQGYTQTGEMAGVIMDSPSGATAVTKAATSGVVWTLSGTNTYTGTTTVTNGQLTVANSSGLGSTTGATTVSNLGSLALDGTTGNGALSIGAEALTLNGAGTRSSPGALRNIGGANSYGGLITLSTNAVTIQSDAGSLAITNAGTITGAGLGLTLSGAGNGSIASIIGTTTGGLTKAGTGTWSLSGANTYTGTTTVNNGTLNLDQTLGGTHGTLNGAGTGTALTLGGGNFKLTGANSGTSSQTMAAFTLTTNSGSAITIDPNGGTSTTLTLGNAWSRAAGSTLLFDYSSANSGTRTAKTTGATTGTTISNGVYGWATVKDTTGTGFATLDGSNNVVRYQAATTLPTTATTSTVNYVTKVGDAGYSGSTITLPTGAKSMNSLQLDGSGASAGVVDLGTGTLTLTAAGILSTGANGYTIQNGQVGAANVETIVHTMGTGGLTISGTVGSGTASLTKDGSDTLTLSGSNAYTGQTTINAGTLATSGANKLADTSNLLVNPGATFSLGGNDTIGSLINVTANGNGTINLNGNTLTTSGGTFAGVISGSGGSLVASNSLTLSGANTYTGTTTINAGTLTVQNNTALGTTAGGTVVASGATLSLDGTTLGSALTIGNEALTLNGGTLSVAQGSFRTEWGGLLTLGASSTINVGGGNANNPGNLIMSNTGNITGTGFTLTLGNPGGVVQTSFGALYGTINTGTGGAVTKTGTGTWTLLGGGNYTGATTISTGGQLIIANSSALGTTAGATTVASGASLGLNGTSTNGNLSVGAEPLTISGTGTTGNLQGAVENISGSNTFGGLLTLAADATIQSDQDSTVAFTNAGTITGSGFNLTVTGPGNGSIASIIGTGAGGVVKSGNGIWTLSGANTYTGATTVNAGILTIKDASALGTTASGTTVVAGGGLALDGSGGNLTVGSEALSLSGSGVSGTTGALENIAGTNVYQGAITLANPTTIQSDAGSIDLQGGISGAAPLVLTGAGNGSISSAITTTGAVVSLTKTGSGIWTLSGANTYTGATLVSAGTLAYGASNAIATGIVNVNGSTAVLDLGANHTDTVGTITLAGGGSITGTGTSALTTTGTFELQSGSMSAGLAGSGAVNKTTSGTVVLSGTNGNTGNTTITTGNLQFAKEVSLYNNNTTGGGWSSNIDVKAAATLGLNVGGTGEFTSTDVDTIVQNAGFENGSFIGLDTTNASGGNFSYNNDLTDAAGGFAQIGLNKLGLGTLTLTVGNDYSGGTVVTAGTLALSGSGTLGQNITANSVTVLNGATLNLGGKSVVNTLGAMTGGTVTNGTITNNSGTYAMQSGTVGAALSGSNALLKTTTGTVVLSGANGYTGTTTVGASSGTDAGILQLSGSGKISNAATTVFAGLLNLNGTTQTITTLGLGAGAAGTMATVAIGAGELKLGGNVTYTATNNPAGAVISSDSGGHLSLLGDRTFTVNDSTGAATDLIVSANLQNGDATARNLTKAGAGNLTLSGTNTYTGITTISTGMAQFAREVSLYNNNTAGTGWTGTNIVVSSAATLGLNVGGTGEFTASDVNTLSGLSGMASGSFLALDSTNGNFSDSGVITGTGVGLTKLGANSVTLSGANTYTGATTVNAGTLVLDRSGGGAGTLNGSGTGTTLTLGGGTFQFKGANNTASTQTMGNLTLSSNSSNGITVTPGTGTGTAVLTLGNTWNRAVNSGSVLNINLPTGSTLTSNATVLNGLVVGSTASASSAFATVTDSTGTGFATVTGGNVVKYTGATTLTVSNGNASTTNFVTKVGDPGYDGNKTLTLTTAPTVNSLQIDTSGGTGTLNLAALNLTLTDRAILATGANGFTISGTSATGITTGSNELIVHQFATGALTIAATIASTTTGLSKDGTGELILSGATSAFSGATNIFAGQLTDATTGALSGTSNVTVFSGAALALKPYIPSTLLSSQLTITNPLTLNGAGLAASPAGALRNLTGNNIQSGLVTLGSNSTIASDDGLLTLSGGVAGPYNLTLAGAGNGAVTSAIALSTGSVTKTGAGTWTLSNADSYSGGTTVTLGTLVVGNAAALGSGVVSIASGAVVSNGTGTGFAFSNNVVNNGTINSNGYNVSFASDRTLSGTGLLSGGGTYTVNGTISPGNSPGTVSVGAGTTLTLMSGATTIWQLNSIVSSVAGTNYDTFVLSPTAVVNVDGTLQIALDGISFSNNPYWETDHSYTLFSGGGTVNGTYAGISGDYTYTNLDGTGTFGYNSGSQSITYTWVAVPEPQTWALAALGASAVLFRLRRNGRRQG